MSTIKTLNGLAWASVKTRNGLAAASIKTIGGVDVPASGSPFGGLVDATNLIEWWALDEASGNALSSHGSHDLTDNNTVTATTGPDGSGARQFTAANTEFFSRTSETDLQIGDIDFGFCASIYVDSFSNDLRIISKRANGTTSLEYDFYVNTAGTLSLILCTAAGSQFSASSSVGAISTATWYKVFGWHDATANTVNVQINAGTPSSTGTSGQVPTTNTSTFEVGQLQQVTRPFNGRMQKIGFWKNDFPDSTERTALYDSGNHLAY